MVLNQLGDLAMLRRDVAQARQVYRQGVERYEKLDDRGGLAAALTGLGRAALAQGDHTEAAVHFYRALDIARDMQFVRVLLSLLTAIAEWMCAGGQAERGAELCALVAAHPSSEQKDRKQAAKTLAHCQADLSPEQYAESVRRGKKGDLDDAVLDVQAELAAWAGL